tara:strand:+ start:3738 stop:3893 length:156 start_codon:yes stop_codon:yes gene_type:complete
MASSKHGVKGERPKTCKKTRNGQSINTKYGSSGPHGGGKKYKKKYRGQGRR